jgi:hypothetical protein
MSLKKPIKHLFFRIHFPDHFFKVLYLKIKKAPPIFGERLKM